MINSVSTEGKNIITLDNVEIKYNTPFMHTIEGLDEKGDRLNLVLVFKAERAVDLYIGDEYIKKNFAKLSALSPADLDKRTLDVRLNLTGGEINRFEGEYINNQDRKMFLILYNTMQPGDEKKEINETLAKFRIDITVEEKSSEEESNILVLVLIFIAIAIVVAIIVVLVLYIGRKRKDQMAFWDTAGDTYYVFKGRDGSIFYFSYEQYASMYQADQIVEYEYLGQSRSIGGEIMPEYTEGQFTSVVEPVEASPVMSGMDEPLPAQPISLSGDYYPPYSPLETAESQPSELEVQQEGIEEPPVEQGGDYQGAEGMPSGTEIDIRPPDRFGPQEPPPSQDGIPEPPVEQESSIGDSGTSGEGENPSPGPTPEDKDPGSDMDEGEKVI